MSDRIQQTESEDKLVLPKKGICLVLGAGDTGKTTLVTALARHTCNARTVAIVDADIGRNNLKAILATLSFMTLTSRK